MRIDQRRVRGERSEKRINREERQKIEKSREDEENRNTGEDRDDRNDKERSESEIFTVKLKSLDILKTMVLLNTINTCIFICQRLTE